MRKLLSGWSWKKAAYVAGFGLVALAIVDTVVQWRTSGFSAGLGGGVGSNVTGQSVFAFLLVGIIVGMLCGIVMAFSYFMWREKKLQDEPDELAQLLDELAQEEAEALYVEDTFEADEKSDSLEPWERPTDWWKKEDE